MKLPTVVQVRVPILLTMAVSVIFGLFYFYGQPKFFQFAISALVIILLIAPLLWLDALRRVDVTLRQIIVIPLTSSWLASTLHRGEKVLSAIWGILLLVGVISILIRIFIHFQKQHQIEGGRA